MDYLDLIDKMSLSELLEFAKSRIAYKEILKSAEDIIAKKEADYEYEREERQLEYLEKEG